MRLRGVVNLPSWSLQPLAMTRGPVGLAIFLPVQIFKPVESPLMCQTLLICVLSFNPILLLLWFLKGSSVPILQMRQAESLSPGHMASA